MVNHRKAKEEDRADLSALWQAAFKDEQPYIDFVFDRFAGLEHTWVAEEAGQVIASVCAVPVLLKKLPGVYIYGVNTRADLRGKGVMKALLETVHNEEKKAGRTFAALVPASASLFDYYKLFGYETMFYRRVVQRSIRANLWAVADFDTITAPRLATLREERMACDYMSFEKEAHAAMVQDLYTGGATTIETDNGYGVYFETRDTLVFKELLADGSSAAAKILEAARQKTGREQAEIYLPQYSDVFLGEGELCPYGMLCWLDGPHQLTDPYMGLMCD